MAYEKRVCVLHQIKKGFAADGGDLSGAVYAERLGSDLTVTPRLLGLSPLKEGRYALSFSAAGKQLLLPLEGSAPIPVSGAPSIKDGFAVLLCYLRTDAEPIAYGRCGIATATVQELLDGARLVQKGDTPRKKPVPVPLSPFETPAPAPNVPTAPGVPVGVPDEPAEPEEERAQSPSFRGQSYDDDAIAASDYFRAHEDEEAPASCGEAEEQVARSCNPSAHEAPLFPEGSLTYYRTVQEKLDEAFKRFPKDDGLKKVFPQSEWVRSGNGALLGIVYQNGVPKYLCVAVEKKGDAPEEMQGQAVFVPRDSFSEEEGYYVVFQSADTGELVTISEG